MSNRILHWPRRAAPRLLLLASLGSLVAACNEEKDATSFPPAAGSGGDGSGGSLGGSGSGGNGNGGSGNVSNTRDASTDAASDAESSGNVCVVGTIDEYCSILDCPPLAEARSSLRRIYALEAEVIVQRPCAAPDGSPRLSVSARYLPMSKTLIYDAETEQLVGVEVIDDTGDCSGGPRPVQDGFGEFPGFYGEYAPDCGSGFPDFFIPAACDSTDAGVLDAGPDAGPRECIVTS